MIRCADIDFPLSIWRFAPGSARLIYIIIRPIPVNEKVPDHYKSDSKRQGGIFGKDLGIGMRNMSRALEYACHKRLDKVQDGDPEANPGGIHQEEHAQLVQEVA
jgi:hypothetical protein